jgi:hypothetical protein
VLLTPFIDQCFIRGAVMESGDFRAPMKFLIGCCNGFRIELPVSEKVL